MGFEVVKRTIAGISFGGIYFFVVLTILNAQTMNIPVSKLWVDMMGCLIIGIYFGVSSLIFDIERWSRLKQTVTHAILSLIIFFPIAIGLGWIPLDVPVMITCFIIFIAAYALFWFGAWWYYRKLTQSMNDLVRK